MALALTPGEMRRDLLLLAWPAVLENLLQSAVGFADSFFVSRLGLHAVAAVGVSNAIFQIYFAIFTAVATASGVFAARATGAGHGAPKAAAQGLWLAALCGLALGLIAIPFAGPLLTVMGADAEVRTAGEAYFRIVAAPSAVIGMMYAAGSILRAAGDTRAALTAGMWMNAAHVILDPILIFGVGFTGFGIEGAAMATVLARAFGLVLLIVRLRRRGLIAHSWAELKPDWAMLWRMSGLGAPAALERLAMRSSQVVYFGLILGMGTKVYAAHTLTSNFTLFAAVAGTGLAAATTARVGQRIGAGDEAAAKAYLGASLWLSVILMTALGFAGWGAGYFGARLFTSDLYVTGLMAIALLLNAVTQPFTALVSTLTATLQAGGDTRFPMLTTLVGAWAVRTVGVYVLGIVLGWGLAGVWIAILIDNILRAGALWWRYRAGNWIRPI